MTLLAESQKPVPALLGHNDRIFHVAIHLPLRRSPMGVVNAERTRPVHTGFAVSTCVMLLGGVEWMSKIGRYGNGKRTMKAVSAILAVFVYCVFRILTTR